MLQAHSPDFLISSLMRGCVRAQLLQSCLTLCNPMDCSPPGSSVHGIFQARILEWVAVSFSRGIFPTQGSNQLSPVSPALQVVNLKHAAAELLRRNHDTDVGITVMLLGTILNLPNRQFQRPWLCLVFPG